MKLERVAKPSPALPQAAPGFVRRLLGHSQLYNFFFAPRRVEVEPVILGQRRIFILPTLHGITFAMALILMLIGSVNYQLALGFMLTFLLTAMSLIGIVHAFRNLVHIEVRAGRTAAVFAGDAAHFALKIDNRGRYDRFSIVLRRGKVRTDVDIPAGNSAQALLDLPAEQRGWLSLGRVTLETRYPLGLCRAWGYAQLDLKALVYPRPEFAKLPPEQEIADHGETVTTGFGADDFAGLRPYQLGDSPRHIAWKSMTRDDAPLLVKQFSGRGAVELWLDWHLLPHELDTEARLSRLAGWVIQAEDEQRFYGLRLPGQEIAPERGPQHRERCLKALALFDIEGTSAP